MSALKQLIKNIIVEEIKIYEKAKNLTNVKSMALLIAPYDDFFGKGKIYVLYNPKKLLVDVNSMDENDESMEEKFVYNDLSDYFLEAILGMLIVSDVPKDYGKSYGTKMVKNSAAKNKYGPLLYDIALSDNKKFGLIPDRNAVSTSANKVWNFYYNKRSDVVNKPLDNIDDPKTKTVVDDSKYLAPANSKNPVNNAYWIKNPKNYDKLIKNHEIFKNQLAKIWQKKLQAYWSSGKIKKKVNIKPKDIETYIIDGAILFFDEKYENSN